MSGIVCKVYVQFDAVKRDHPCYRFRMSGETTAVREAELGEPPCYPRCSGVAAGVLTIAEPNESILPHY